MAGCSGLCGPADPLGAERPDPAGRRPDRHLGCVRRRPRGWDATEVSALQTYAGLAATLLGTAAKAERSGRLAEQLKVALEARNQLQEAKVAMMDRERLDDQQALIDLRRDEIADLLEQDPGGDWIGRKLSQLLLGFLATEVVPLANQLAGLGIDPTPLFTTASGILRLYADALDRPDPRR
jgi:hypothetical protein